MMHVQPNNIYHLDLFDLCDCMADESVDMWYNRGNGAVLKTPAVLSKVYYGDRTMPNYTTRICPVCNVEYQADLGRLKHGRQTTCSRECSYKLRGEKLAELRLLSPRREVTWKIVGRKKIVDQRICKNCGNVVERPPSGHRHKNTFCCSECYQDYRFKHSKYTKKEKRKLRQKRFCVICGTIFKPAIRSGRLQSHCSRKCFEVSHKYNMRGENNPSYIDGRSYSATYDAGAEWHTIRFEVYKRDNFTCQQCGVKCVSKSTAMENKGYTKRIIQCHHINPYNESKDNSLENLTTLCISCHRDFHLRKGGHDTK